MNIIDLVIIFLCIAIVCITIIFSVIKRKSGKTSCGCNCANCLGCDKSRKK